MLLQGGDSLRGGCGKRSIKACAASLCGATNGSYNTAAASGRLLCLACYVMLT